MTDDRPRFDLVVIGDVNPDIVVSAPDLVVEFGQREVLADSAELTLGGSAAITACAAARLGMSTAFVGVVGDDEYGRWCLAALERHGVDTAAVAVDPGVATALTVILQRRDDRAIVTVPGSIAALGDAHVDRDLLSATRHVHVGSYFLLDGLRDAVPSIFDAAHAAGATTSLDPNDDPRRHFDAGAALDRVDVLLPNEQEARAFAGVDDVATAVDQLALRVGTVAVTRGAAGAIARRADETVIVGVGPKSGVVDAVGAGDNFDAGFLFGFVHGWPLERCVRAGLGAAAISMRGRGGTSSLGTIDEALAEASGPVVAA